MRSALDAQVAIAAGASYLLTPALGAGVNAALQANVGVLAAAQTPSEILRAWKSGAAAAKLFPASLGGVEYFRALRAPFLDFAVVPVSAVGTVQTREYLGAGAVAVGIDSPLFIDALDEPTLSAAARSGLTPPAAGIC